MKNFKKILVLALAVMMCLTALSVPAFAAFNPEVKITARFNEAGDRIIASVVTTEAGGAIQGTLTFSGLELDKAHLSEDEDASNDSQQYEIGENKVDFVILAKELTGGTTHWADFYFLVPNEAQTVTFGLTNVAVCDVNENLADDGITVPEATLVLTANDLTTLGAQFREVNPALRFGFRIDRTVAEDGKQMLSETKQALRCGYILASSAKIEEGTELTASFNTETGKIDSVTTNAKYYQATKCYDSQDTYMIYTAAIFNIKEAAENTPIVAKPYVIYYDSAEGKYGIEFGAQVTKSFADVKTASGLLDETLGYK